MCERENVCNKTGCFGYCCSDMTLYIPASERRRCFPDAHLKNLEKLNGPLENGVHCAGSGYIYHVYFEYVRIVGSCPNLKGGACGIYEERPSACRNFEFGSTGCDEIRVDNNLPPIPAKML